MHTMTIEQYVRQVTGTRFAKIPVDGKSRSFRDAAKRVWYVVGFDDVRILWSRSEVHSIAAGGARVIDMDASSGAVGALSLSLMMLAGEPGRAAAGERMAQVYLPAAIEAATQAGVFETVTIHGD